MSMVIGVGVDILKFKHLEPLMNNLEDPFWKRTFTPNEYSQGMNRDNPLSFFSSRFSAKEAVFKCLKVDGNAVRLYDIEVTNMPEGYPVVELLGQAKYIAEKKKIKSIELSISYEDDCVIAYAMALKEIVKSKADEGIS